MIVVKMPSSQIPKLVNMCKLLTRFGFFSVKKTLMRKIKVISEVITTQYSEIGDDKKFS